MPYYVLGPGGSKFGPAEIPLLAQWALEGRLLPETLIEDTGGVKMPARALNGLSFPTAPDVQPTPTAPPGQGVDPQLPTTLVHTGANLPGRPLDPSLHAGLYVPPAAMYQPAPPSLYDMPRGGSPHNTFLPGVQSNWAIQAFICAFVAPFATFFFGLDKIGLFALFAPIYAITLSIRARESKPTVAVFAIILNVIGFLAGIGMMFFREMKPW